MLVGAGAQNNDHKPAQEIAIEMKGADESSQRVRAFQATLGQPRQYRVVALFGRRRPLPVTQFLADEQIVAAVYEALAKCWPKSRSRGRFGAPAEMVLRMLVLKHVRN
jgi:hypothetical protein